MTQTFLKIGKELKKTNVSLDLSLQEKRWKIKGIVWKDRHLCIWMIAELIMPIAVFYIKIVIRIVRVPKDKTGNQEYNSEIVMKLSERVKKQIPDLCDSHKFCTRTTRQSTVPCLQSNFEETTAIVCSNIYDICRSHSIRLLSDSISKSQKGMKITHFQ